MAKLITIAIMKLTVLIGLFKWSIATTLASDENGISDGIPSDASTPPAYFEMINDYDRSDGGSSNGELVPIPYGALAQTSDRRSVVECGGVYKRLQSEIRSPGYPDGYQTLLHCEYTFKSPFVCSSQYHFQFLDFSLEPSRNCTKDRLVIGEEEVLCGTVIGSKLYDAPGGLLRMKLVTDGWRSERGFRILVTRQPCSDDNEAEESSTAYTVFSTIQVAEEGTESSAEETTTVEPTGYRKIVSSRQDIPPEFNPGGNGYLPPPTVQPTYPTPGYPNPTNPPQAYPCPAPCLYPSWGCSPPNYPYVPPLPPRVPCDPRYQTCPPQYPGSYPSYPQQPSPSYPSYPQQPQPQYPGYPSYPQQPSYPSYPQYPGCTGNPCAPGSQYPSPVYPGYPQQPGTEGTNSIGGPPPGFEPVKSESEAEFPEPTTERAPREPEPQSQVSFVPGLGPSACCRNAFSQRRFYLSSANFPSQHTINQDCVVQIQRHSPFVCRLVIHFKFFAFGNDQFPACPGGFVEIDGRRICGCRTGQTYRTLDFGPYPSKTIRIHSDAGRFPGVQGFLLDIYQEDCQQGGPLKRSDEDRLVQRQASPVGGRYSYEMGRVEGRLLHVPVQTVQTTNSTTTQQTTRQYYFYDMNDAQPVQKPKEPVGAGTFLTPVYLRSGAGSEKFVQPGYTPQLLGGGGNRCVFTTADWLRLKLDWLWVFKPVCLV
ncbi:uncharacterized protein LOC118458174 [Anopheles albimanus]|nr:uncharacterized protein LOC118458174 [Anopheles albimanus]